ncbi:MAG: D-alanine--D-alanine ligase, partial [Candidatus Pacebacteria bacterium]|nr:D-alanine--D-alanine ligase [Candidatus Paceibacterota bacterium]
MKVAVLMGGWSAEREVSLSSGRACIDALQGSGHEITPVDVGHDIGKVLTELKPDVALNALHGPYGEDGSIQGLLEILEIPYTHSGVLASALAMNKARSRELFRAARIPIAEGEVVSRFDAAREHVMIPPYVLKPIANGSSVGVFIVREGDEPPSTIGADDWKFGDLVLAEKYIAGKELTCAVMGDRALEVTEITSELPFYNYQAKYSDGGSTHVLPAQIDVSVYARVRAIALLAHQTLGCRGVSRSDFRYDPTTGELVCLEVNS